MANQKLNVEITANDKASAKIEAAADKADALDRKKVEVDVSANTAGVSDALDALDVPLGGVAGKLGGLASPGGAIAAIGGGLLVAANNAANLAIEADNLSALTGDSVEHASRLNAVWKTTGADTKDLQDVMLQMNGVLATNADIAKELGINLDDGATIGMRFEEVARALDQIPDAAKRSQLASQIFGEEGVRQYNALKQAVGDLSIALTQVPEGSVFSADDVENARKTKAEIGELTSEFEALANRLGTLVIPLVGDLVGGLNDLFAGAEDTGRSIRALFDSTARKNFAITEEFEDAEQAARDFDRSLLDGLDTFEAVRAKVLEVTGSEHAANQVALEWSNTNNSNLTPSLDAAATSTELLTTAVDEVVPAFGRAEQAIEFFGTALKDKTPAEQFGEAMSTANQVLAELGDTARDTADSVASSTEQFEEFFAALDQQDMLEGIVDDFEAVQAAAEAAAEGGKEDADRHAGAIRELQRSVGRYVQSLEDIPPEKLTRILAEINSGDVDRIYQILSELSQGVTVPVAFMPGTMQPGSSGIGSTFNPGTGGVSSGVQNPNPAPSQSAIPGGSFTTVTNIYPVGSTPTTQWQDGRIDDRRNGAR